MKDLKPMAKRTQTFSIRLEVADDGKVKAAFINVGKEGDRAFKKIRKGSTEASSGLNSLTNRAKKLSKNIKLLGVAAAAIATVGGLALLTKKSIDAADSIAKTADNLGISTDALQEYRFAADLAGVSSESLEAGFEQLTKKTGELKTGQGTLFTFLQGTNKELLNQLTASKSTEEALDLVLRSASEAGSAFERNSFLAAAFGQTLGVELGGLAKKGGDALEATRQQARDLGVVLEEDLLRGAEGAKKELAILERVVSANVNRALLDLTPLIIDTSGALSDLAADAGNAYEKLLLIFQGDFEFDGQSLRGLNRDLKNLREEIEKVDEQLERRRALQAEGGFKALFGGGTEVDIIFQANRRKEIVEKIANIEERINAIRAERDETGANGKKNESGPSVEELKKQAQAFQSISKSLEKQLFNLNNKGSERIKAEADLLVEQIKALKDIASGDQIAGLIEQAREVENLQLAEFTAKQAAADEKAREAAEKRTEAERLKAEAIKKTNQTIIEGLNNEIAALGKSERQNFVDQATRRLSAEATETQRIEVERLASALFDEKEAAEAVRKEHEREIQLIENIVNLTDDQTDAQARYNKELEELNRLRKEEKITSQQLAVAEEDARRRMLAASRLWINGVERALRDYADQATNSARQAEDITLSFLRKSEDAFIQFAQTGKFEFRDLLNSIVADINRALVQQNITGPLAKGLNNIIGSIDFGSLFGSAKGNVFSGGAPVKAFASGGVVNKPTTFPMTNGIGLLGEAGPEAILPLRRLPSGKLGVESAGSGKPSYVVNVDARGSTDPGATAAQVEQAVDRALSTRIPGIVRASSQTAKAEVIDAFQRRGGRFD